jgi:serine/threonine-protein kinase
VVSESVITVTRLHAVNGWAGRSHSLWFCDAIEEGLFRWYEHAFMTMAFAGSPSTIEPFALDSIDAGPVLRPGLVRQQRAWNFEELDRSDPSDFINRWLGWFGKAAQGELQRPQMPEQTIRTDYWWNR